MFDFFSRFNQEYFFSIPASSKAVYLWFAFFLLVLTLSVIMYFVYRKKSDTEKPYRSFAKKFLWTEIPVSIIGLMFIFFRFEGVKTYAWRFWAYLLVLVVVVIGVWLCWERRKLNDKLTRFNQEQRKKKWLKKKK